MKILFFALIPIFIVQHQSILQPKKNKKVVYYFCDSHSRQAGTIIKQNILYTDVYSASEEVMPDLTKKWCDLVNANCKDGNSCTSNLNYYPTEAQANAELEKTKHLYANPRKYDLKKIDFK